MTILYVLLAVYVFSINFYAFRLIKTQRDDWEAGECERRGDGKLILAAILGGAVAVFAGMFAMRFRLSNLLLMVLMPLLAVLNGYCFFLAFRSIYLFV